MDNKRECELINDEQGWWLQYEIEQGIHHCYHMDATDEIDAQHEAMQEGFTEMKIIRPERATTVVKIPKSPFP